jgi:hypothetical protein
MNGVASAGFDVVFSDILAVVLFRFGLVLLPKSFFQNS